MALYGIREEQPGSRWQALHDVTRDAYHRWYLSEGAAARPDLGTCRRMLAKYMPELVPAWERLVELPGGDEVTARLLRAGTARFLPGCSQATLGAAAAAGGSAALAVDPDLRLRPGTVRAGGVFERVYGQAGPRNERLPLGAS